MSPNVKASSGQATTNTILIITALVQIILVGIVYIPRFLPTKSEVGTLLEVKTSDIIGLEISDGEEQISLAKDGDEWVLPEADNFLVKSDRLEPFLDKLVSLETQNLIANSKASHKRLQVADSDFVRKLGVSLKGNKKLTLYIGSSPSNNVTHTRLDRQDSVYLVNDLRSYDAPVETSSWIETLYFEIEQDNVVSLTLENKNGDLNFSKDANGGWELADVAEDEEINETALNSLLRKASTIRMVRPLGKEAKAEYGLDDPVTITVVTEEELEAEASTEESEEEEAEPELVQRSYTLTLGDELDDGFVIKASESEYYVVISNSNASDFVEKKREDFIVEPEEEPVADDLDKSSEDGDGPLELEVDGESTSDTESSEEGASDAVIDEEDIPEVEVDEEGEEISGESASDTVTNEKSEEGTSDLETNQEGEAEANEEDNSTDSEVNEENNTDSEAGEETVPNLEASEVAVSDVTGEEAVSDDEEGEAEIENSSDLGSDEEVVPDAEASEGDPTE